MCTSQAGGNSSICWGGVLTPLCFPGCGETRGMAGPGPTFVVQSTPRAQAMMLACTLHCPSRGFPAQWLFSLDFPELII